MLNETEFGRANVSRDGYISDVFVKEENRGQGHGHELMQSITAQADATGQVLNLNAREDLHGFYGRHGFQATGDVDFGQPRMTRQPR